MSKLASSLKFHYGTELLFSTSHSYFPPTACSEQFQISKVVFSSSTLKWANLRLVPRITHCAFHNNTTLIFADIADGTGEQSRKFKVLLHTWFLRSLTNEIMHHLMYDGDSLSDTEIYVYLLLYTTRLHETREKRWTIYLCNSLDYRFFR